ncbi:MAG TPA: amidase family protein [Gemmatimonadaceae bacterium]|jgi:Asp-tRNA(Asn)/Glu-tRNA(Gln) amidotransferase A subunit family amidase|nr:amidase family protein [Gemmatimonadaceae bacterium]
MRPLALALLSVSLTRAAAAQTSFRVDETTIADVHAAMRAGSLTCRALVQAYLRRIDAYDKLGPAINAITVVNPDALAIADSLDKRFAATRQMVGPLHCIPMIVKDNFQTIGLQTAAGNLALKGYEPSKDAFQVKRVKEAGAIVLAKSNMAEFAFSPYETVNSVLPGYTKNPYALDRVTAGSSGGTAAAVASDLGEVGLGTDTGNSIRGPSSHNALVGIRSTMGLTSRAGIAPLSLFADIAGPMARTVADATAVLQVIAGYDPDDPVTQAVQGKPIPNYAASLVRDGLKGARIGVLRQAFEAPTVDPEVRAVFDKALADLRRAGATVLDTVIITEMDSIRRAGRGDCNPFKYEFNQWLAEQGDRVPVNTIDSIYRSGRYHPSVQARLERALRYEQSPDSAPGCGARQRTRAGLRDAVTHTMDRLQLDALVYPTWSNPPRLIGDLNTPAGDNSQVFSPTTGMPAITVPMGYTRQNALPAGMTFFGRAFDEPRLIKLAYGFEQTTKWRREPASTPPLASAP